MTFLRHSIFKKPKFLVTNHNSSQTTSSSRNALTTIAGSQIDYTPDNDATKVIYEISFYMEANKRFFYAFYLEEYNGSTWVKIDSKNTKNLGISYSDSQFYRYIIHYRFILPAWTGNKQLRLTTASESSSDHLDMHQITAWDGTSSSNTFCNTNLLVYSI